MRFGSLGWSPTLLPLLLLCSAPRDALAVVPAGDAADLGGTALEPAIHTRSAAVQLHDSDGPVPQASARLRRSAQDALHASLEASAFADEADEASAALRTSTGSEEDVPAELSKLVGENAAAARQAAALAQMRAQASWDAVARFEGEVDARSAAADAAHANWRDVPLAVEWPHVSAELFNPSMMMMAGGGASSSESGASSSGAGVGTDGDAPVLVAFRQQLRNQQRCVYTVIPPFPSRPASAHSHYALRCHIPLSTRLRAQPHLACTRVRMAARRVCDACDYVESYYSSSVALGWFAPASESTAATPPQVGEGGHVVAADARAKAPSPASMRQLTPLTTLRDTALFGPDRPYDCVQLKGGFNFGPEDPRLLSLSATPTPASAAAGISPPRRYYLLFHARAHFGVPGVPCRRIGEHQQHDPAHPNGYTAIREEGLQPYLVPLEITRAPNSTHAARARVRPLAAGLVQLHIADAADGDTLDDTADGVGAETKLGSIGAETKLGSIEKNWSPFEYLVPSSTATSSVGQGAPQMLAVYAVAPEHIILAIDPETGAVSKLHATPNRVCSNTLGRTPRGLCAVHAVDEPLDARPAGAHGDFRASVHGGGGVVLVPAGHGRPEPFFLSVLHTVDENAAYSSYLYRFRAQPPFDILDVSAAPLPLQRARNGWGATVAFPTSLTIGPAGSDNTPTLHIAYGKGDRDSRVASITLTDLADLEFATAATPPSAPIESPPRATALIEMQSRASTTSMLSAEPSLPFADPIGVPLIDADSHTALRPLLSEE